SRRGGDSASRSPRAPARRHGARPRRSAPAPEAALTPSAAPGEQMDQGDEQRGADDRPQHGEGMATDHDGEGFREAQLARHPGPEQGADEADDGGDDEAATSIAGERL